MFFLSFLVRCVTHEVVFRVYSMLQFVFGSPRLRGVLSSSSVDHQKRPVLTLRLHSPFGGKTYTARASKIARSDETFIPSLPCSQSSCCTSEISNSGIYCSDTLVAPCIIDDDGASCRAVAKAGLTTSIIWLTAFLTTACAPSVAHYPQLSLLFVATHIVCLNTS